jgi:tyrosine-protein kinase Etk/Wzc
MSLQQFSPTDISPAEHDEFRLLDLVVVLTRHRKLILGIFLAALVVATLISASLPATYAATAQLLPARKKTSGAAGLLSQVGGAAAAAGISSLKTPGAQHIGMLKSAAVADRLIARFGLKKVYGTSSQEEARRELAQSTTIVSNKQGLITLKVEAGDKRLAAGLANAYVEELTRLQRQFAMSAAVQWRSFFKRELDVATQNLASAELAYRRGLDQGGLAIGAADAQSIAENMARLRGRISAQQVQLDAMRAFVTSRDDNFRRVQEELASLRAELTRLQEGTLLSSPAQARNDQHGGQHTAGLLRQVKYYELLSELLVRQYETARLNAADDSSMLQLLDAAVEPEEHVKPRRLDIVLLSGLAGLIIGISCAFVAEAQRRYVLQPGGAARWNALRSHLLSR